MTDPLEGKRTEDVLWEVLGIETYCATMLGFLIAAYLGRDEFSIRLIERELVERQRAPWKRETLRAILKNEGWDHNPYDVLPAALERLTDFRNRVAHSQPDHGDHLRRLVRRRGQNEPPWVITRLDVTEHWELAIASQSQLIGLWNKMAALLGPAAPDSGK